MRNQQVLRISDVKFTAGTPFDSERGLLGWISCSVNRALRIDGLTLRRTADGRYVVSFPARLDGGGRQRFYVRPLDDHARREIELQILRALGLEEVVRP